MRHMVAEREEWLVEWSEAVCEGEISFLGSGARPNPESAAAEAFVSEALDVGGACLVCRASGAVVSVFDVSPAAFQLRSWRVLLPSPVVKDVGIAFACDAGGLGAQIQLLTADAAIYALNVVLPRCEGAAPEVRQGPAAQCRLPSAPLCFAAVDRNLSAVGCQGGTLHVLRLPPAGPLAAAAGYELAAAHFLRRLVDGFLRPSPPGVLALAAAGGGGDGVRLLSYSEDGRLQLWEVSARQGCLIAAGAVEGVAGAVSIRVGAVENQACLVSRSRVHTVDLSGASGALPVRPVAAPFPGAAPGAAAISQGALWCLWSSASRQQLVRCELADVEGGGAMEVEGADPGGARGPRCVISLAQQHEVWRGEEDAFKPIPAACNASDNEALEVALRWWAGRVLLPGRFPRSAVAAALQEVGGMPCSAREGRFELRSAVEGCLRRQCGMPPPSLAGGPAPDAASTFEVMRSLASSAASLIHLCEVASRRSRQVRGLSATSAWAPHAWCPAGDGPGTCPAIFYDGGVSIVREVRSWQEKWWATCHVSLDLAGHDKMGLEKLLDMSAVVEWKTCVMAWFVSQCVGSANASLTTAAASDVPAAAAALVRLLPQRLASHVDCCGRAVADAAAAAGVRGGTGDDAGLVRMLRAACRPEESQVPRLDALPIDAEARLADLLRGGAMASECEHTFGALRDLSLLGAYIAASGAACADALSKDTGLWQAVSKEVTDNLSVFGSLHASMTMEVGCRGRAYGAVARKRALPPLPLRAADVWAAGFRSGGIEGRPSAASCRSFRYAALLLRHECWAALRAWCANEEALGDYVYARELLACGHGGPAVAAFERAAGTAAVLMEQLTGARHEAGARATAAYFEHVAGALGEYGALAEEQQFLHKAATLAEDAAERQRLWRAVFQKAMALELLEAACRALEHIDRPEAEGLLPKLAHKLQRAGRVDFVEAWPQHLMSRFMNLILEYAVTSSAPDQESASCYNLLYAMHFRRQDYYRAAAVAYSFYAALERFVDQPAAGAGADGPSSAVEFASGGCISDAGEVPRKRGAAPGAAPMATDEAPRPLDEDRHVLELQRAALLMLSSALALTRGEAILAPHPPPQQLRAAAPEPMVRGSGGAAAAAAGGALSARLEQLLERAPSSPALADGSGCWMVDAKDVQRLQAHVEARLAVSGIADGATDPGAVVERVAEHGYLALALQVAFVRGLDPWRHALRPFVRLCVDGGRDGLPPAAVLESARGPVEAMFVRSDGFKPLGSEGDLLQAWWSMLEAGLRAASGLPAVGQRARSTGEGRLDAAGARLFSLVADELLERRPRQELPRFLREEMSCSPFWVELLRVYMKRDHLNEAVDLVAEQLARSQKDFVSLDAKRFRWTPLCGFPADLAEQLRCGVARASERGSGVVGLREGLLRKLDDILAQYSRLLADSEL